MEIKRIPGELCDQTLEIQQVVEELAKERNNEESPQEVWNVMKEIAAAVKEKNVNPAEVALSHLEAFRQSKLAHQSYV